MRTLRPEHLRPQSCTLLPNLQQHDWKRFTEIVWKIYRACFCVSKSPTKKVDERRAGLRFALLHDVSGRFAPIPPRIPGEPFLRNAQNISRAASTEDAKIRLLLLTSSSALQPVECGHSRISDRILGFY